MADNNSKSTESSVAGPALNRRRLLKAAVATAPVIATLSSGAALARSSNVIGSTSGPGLDAQGRTLCLDRSSGTYADGYVDLGAPPHGRVTAIRDRDYRVDDSWFAGRVSEKEMCKKGGRFHYWNSGWRSANVPRGIVVSATALSSFAGTIYTTEV
jgi:hypothetical protein